MWSVKTIKSFPFIRMREKEGERGKERPKGKAPSNTKNRNSISEKFSLSFTLSMIKSSFRFLLLPGMDREGGYEEEIDEENVRIFRKRDDKVFSTFPYSSSSSLHPHTINII